MTKKHAKKVLAAFTVAVLAFTPAFGAVCDMPCGESGESAGSSCCCSPSVGSGSEVLANPSCCTAEVKSSDPGILVRAAGSAGTFELTLASPSAAEEREEISDIGRTAPPADSPGKARSSPLFLLHASFIV